MSTLCGFLFFFNLFIWLHWVLVTAGELSCCIWDLVPWPGMEPGPLHWEPGILATGPPGKPPNVIFLFQNSFQDTTLCSAVMSLQVPLGRDSFLDLFLMVSAIFFSLMCTIFNVFIEIVTVLFQFYVWFFGCGACEILPLQPGIEPAPPALEGEVLTTGQPGKSPWQF